jgi:drug/metabolite transporter (DMT)-like permease
MRILYTLHTKNFMSFSDPIFQKPQKFITAKKLLYAGIALSFTIFIIHNIRLTVRPKFLFLGWVVLAIGYIAMLILVKQMDLCRKWARAVLAVWFGLSFIGTILSWFSPQFNQSIIEITIWAMKIVLQTIAFIFLYSKESENWFNNSKYEMFRK